jgi:hypothetical protein
MQIYYSDTWNLTEGKENYQFKLRVELIELIWFNMTWIGAARIVDATRHRCIRNSIRQLC